MTALAVVQHQVDELVDQVNRLIQVRLIRTYFRVAQDLSHRGDPSNIGHATSPPPLNRVFSATNRTVCESRMREFDRHGQIPRAMSAARARRVRLLP
jgi:hypothetical protein